MKFNCLLLTSFALAVINASGKRAKIQSVEGSVLPCHEIRKSSNNSLAEQVFNPQLWTSKIINYSFGTVNDEVRNNINKAMGVLSGAFPGLNFQEKASGDYLAFQADGSGCGSSLGRTGGKQPINTDAGCGCTHTIHEILHALGLSHEHERLDRDDHIEFRNINPKNQKDRRHCDMWTRAKRESLNVVTSYDTQSIMHYNAFVAVCNPKEKVMFAKPNNPPIHIKSDNGRCGLSLLDIQKINSLYKLHQIYRPLVSTFQTSKCIQIGDHGDKIFAFWCHAGKEQQFIINGQGEIKSLYDPTKCLDAHIEHALGKISMYPCHGRDNQKWYFDGENRIRSKYNNGCLDLVMADKFGPYNQYDIYLSKSCHNGSNQKFVSMYR